MSYTPRAGDHVVLVAVGHSSELLDRPHGVVVTQYEEVVALLLGPPLGDQVIATLRADPLRASAGRTVASLNEIDAVTERFDVTARRLAEDVALKLLPSPRKQR